MNPSKFAINPERSLVFNIRFLFEMYCLKFFDELEEFLAERKIWIQGTQMFCLVESINKPSVPHFLASIIYY